MCVGRLIRRIVLLVVNRTVVSTDLGPDLVSKDECVADVWCSLSGVAVAESCLFLSSCAYGFFVFLSKRPVYLSFGAPRVPAIRSGLSEY